MLASAAAAIARAPRVARQVDRRRGQRLEADEHVGQAGRVEPAAETDGDLGRRRQERSRSSGRRSTPPAVSARRGSGPSARRLPASHTMSSAWMPPEAGAGGPVGSPEEAVAEALGRHATDARAERLADADRADEGDQDDDRPEGGSIAASGSASVGRSRMRARRRRSRRGDPRPAGSRPSASRGCSATTMSRSVERVESGSPRRSSHRPPSCAAEAMADVYRRGGHVSVPAPGVCRYRSSSPASHSGQAPTR